MYPRHTDFARLRLKNVRCFRDAGIPLDKRVTVIVGGNGCGKTTLMESLASLTHGDDEGLERFPLRHGTSQGEIALYENGKNSAVAKWSSQQTSRQRLAGDRYVFLYGRDRRVLLPESPEESRNLTDSEYLDEVASHATKSRTTTLTRPDNRLLQDLEGYLRGIYSGHSSDPRLGRLWSQLNTALPEMDSSLSEIRMDKGAYHLIPK